jgi:dienelactone hydrolase
MSAQHWLSVSGVVLVATAAASLGRGGVYAGSASHRVAPVALAKADTFAPGATAPGDGVADAQAAAAPADDAALRAFWKAETLPDADGVARQVQASGIDFNALLARLHAGPAYGAERTGRVDMPSADHQGPLDNVVDIPDDYVPDRRWPVRVVLHGGVGRERPAAGEGPRPLTNRLPGAGEIVIQPRAWLESAWWTEQGVSNVMALLSRVKRLYNVDESRVHITGISDGGTGVYFFAMREATPWSACLALNGHPSVLANEDTGADGQLYAHNLINCPLYLVSGGKDPLYPAASVKPFVEMFTKGGVPVTWHVYPDAGHDVSWWPQERVPFEAFVAAHPRVAHPETISWESERTDRYNRFRWLIIDRLGKRPSEATLRDVNEYESVPGPMRALFMRRQPSGRVDAKRTGNVFELQTRGVRELTLLVSPDVIDFARPVTVTVNGRNVHDALVTRSTATLLKWAARDRDRTMLYGAELHITVP